MAISFDKALGVSETALRLRAARAEVLSSNLVNQDTPNFKARDFNFQSALNAAVSASSPHQAQRTQVGHLSGDPKAVANTQMQYRTPTQPSIDGNTVDEHLEHAEFMSNSLEFQTAFTLLSSRFKGLMSAIRGE
jgi:flagellar basal-body rod protein FlgB